jgi:choline dehydrogenase-like flavoprotein
MSSESGIDVIVVGSGAGGSAAAYRLAQAGLRVVVLEKGGVLPRDGSTLDVERVVRRGEFLSREPWLDGSGRRFMPEEHFNVGGKTKWYGAALLRFAPDEFEPQPVRAFLGWPIDSHELKPWYREAEALLGVRTFAPEPDLRRILERFERRAGGWTAAPMPMGLAHGIQQEPREAAHFDGFASVRDLKAEAEVSLLQPLVRSGRVRLETGAEVVTLRGAALDPARITGVRLADGRELTCRTVVLAAGALHSPRILQRYLRSSGLDARLPIAPLVGANLKLHLLTAMVAFSGSRKHDLIRKTVVLTNERYRHSSVQPLGFDGELIAQLIPKCVPRGIARAMGRRGYGFFLQTEDGSHPDNRVSDHANLDPGLPQLDYDGRRCPHSEREHREVVRAFRVALAQAGLPAFSRRIGLAGTAHACGTLASGASPASSVVDAQGRVHGLTQLRVADGSILPRSSRVNPSLTIYAWGLRTGALLANALQGGDATSNAVVERPNAS